MALINPATGEYYKIVSVHIDKKAVTFEIYRDKAHRQAGDDQFLRKHIKSYKFASIAGFLEMADDTVSIANNFIATAYSTIKQQAPFDEYTDD